MGVEVKSGGEGVIVADRGCNDGCCNDRHHYVSQIRKECILHRCTPFFRLCPPKNKTIWKVKRLRKNQPMEIN